MNRLIALLIPAILLVAMALIVFQQFKTSSDEKKEEPIASSSLSPLIGANNTNMDVPSANIPPSMDTAQETRQPVQIPQTEAANATNANSQSGAPSNWIMPNSQKEPPAYESSAAKTTPPDTTTAPAKEPKTALGKLADAQNQPSAVKQKEVATKEKPKTPEAKEKPKTSETKEKPKTEETAETPQDKHTLHSMAFKYQGSDMLLILKADSKFDYKTFMLPSADNKADRLVIDIIGNWEGVTTPNVPSNRLIKGIRSAKNEKGHRIVLDLKDKPEGYETKREGESVIVRIY